MRRIEPRNFGRKDERFKISLAGSMSNAEGAKRINLLDISQAGALVHCVTPPAVHELVDISCGAISVKAEVCWVTKPRFGVKFIEPLGEDIVDALSNCPPD